MQKVTVLVGGVNTDGGNSHVTLAAVAAHWGSTVVFWRRCSAVAFPYT